MQRSCNVEISHNNFDRIATLKIDAKEFQLVWRKKQRIAFTHFKWHMIWFGSVRYVNKIYLILSYRFNSITITKNFILITAMLEFFTMFLHILSDTTWSSMFDWLMHRKSWIEKSTALVNNKFSLCSSECQKRGIATLQTNWANTHFIIDKNTELEKEKTKKFAPGNCTRESAMKWVGVHEKEWSEVGIVFFFFSFPKIWDSKRDIICKLSVFFYSIPLGKQSAWHAHISTTTTTERHSVVIILK